MSELHEICELRIVIRLLSPTDTQVVEPCTDCEALLHTSQTARKRVLHRASEWREQ